MRKYVQQILLTLAVVTVLGHSIIAHQHKETTLISDQQVINDHDDHDDDHDADHHKDHNPFSSKYLDHVYHSSVSFPETDHSITGFVLPETHFDLVPIQKTGPCRFAIRNEHPPPLSFTNTISLRGPPLPVR